jgi:Tfp pilus assembly protein PilV
MLLGSAMRRIDRRQGGHVLLEVVISLFLLTVGFISLARLSLGASWMVRQGRWRTAAVALAAQKMEQLIAVGFRHQALEQVADPENPLGEGGEHDPTGKFYRSWGVSLIEPGLKLLVVEVRWEVPRAGSVEITSLSGSETGEALQ